MTHDKAISFFNDNAEELQAFYNSVERKEVLSPYLKDMEILFNHSEHPHLIDIGAGCGSDAFFLLNHFSKLAITAIEPSDALAQYAQEHDRLSWISDTLPDLSLAMPQLQKKQADAILMDAVFQYVAPVERTKALTKCASFLRKDGRIYINFPNKKTRDYQYELCADDLTQAVNEANLKIIKHQIIKPYNDRRSQSGKKLHFEYFILSKTG